MASSTSTTRRPTWQTAPREEGDILEGDLLVAVVGSISWCQIRRHSHADVFQSPVFISIVVQRIAESWASMWPVFLSITPHM